MFDCRKDIRTIPRKKNMQVTPFTLYSSSLARQVMSRYEVMNDVFYPQFSLALKEEPAEEPADTEQSGQKTPEIRLDVTVDLELLRTRIKEIEVQEKKEAAKEKAEAEKTKAAEKKAAAEEKRAAVEERKAAAEEKRAEAEERKAAAEEKRAAVEERKAAAEEKKAEAEEKREAVKEQNTAAEEKKEAEKQKILLRSILTEQRLLTKTAEILEINRERKTLGQSLRRRELPVAGPVRPAFWKPGKKSIAEKGHPAMMFAEVISGAQEAGVTFGGIRENGVPVPEYIETFEERNRILRQAEEGSFPAVTKAPAAETFSNTGRAIPGNAAARETVPNVAGTALPDLLYRGENSADTYQDFSGNSYPEGTDAGVLTVSGKEGNRVIRRVLDSLQVLFTGGTKKDPQRPVSAAEEEDDILFLPGKKAEGIPAGAKPQQTDTAFPEPAVSMVFREDLSGDKQQEASAPRGERAGATREDPESRHITERVFTALKKVFSGSGNEPETVKPASAAKTVKPAPAVKTVKPAPAVTAAKTAQTAQTSQSTQTTQTVKGSVPFPQQATLSGTGKQEEQKVSPVMSSGAGTGALRYAVPERPEEMRDGELIYGTDRTQAEQPAGEIAGSVLKDNMQGTVPADAILQGGKERLSAGNREALSFEKQETVAGSTSFPERPGSGGKNAPFPEVIPAEGRKDRTPAIMKETAAENGTAGNREKGVELFSPADLSYTTPVAAFSREIDRAIQAGAGNVRPHSGSTSIGPEELAAMISPERPKIESTMTKPTVTYESPFYRELQSQMTLKNSAGGDPRRISAAPSAGRTPQPARISEAEIRRSADRIYKIIKERIRLEQRSGGM